MPPGNWQVITAYEQDDLTPEEIASEYGYETETVKMILLNGSKKFYAQVSAEQGAVDSDTESGGVSVPIKFTGDTFTQSDYNIACRTMVNLLDSEIDAVKYRAAEFVIDECKGRRDLKALKDAGGFNITVVNETMARARAAIQRAKGKAIEVTASRPQQVLEMSHA